MRNPVSSVVPRPVFRAGMQFAFAVCVLGMMAACFCLDARVPAGGRFTAAGWTELAQLAVLLAAGMLFLMAGRFYPGYSRLANLMAVPAWLGLIRKKGVFLDIAFPGAWKVVFVLVFAASVFYAWHHRNAVAAALSEFILLPGWSLLVCGFCMAAVFSRILGLSENWFAILGGLGLREALPAEVFTDVVQTVGRAVEEGTELCGYALIAMAAFSFAVTCRRLRRSGES